jgi:ribosomal protein S18 acetylase RimI-like enzyme
MLIKMRRFTWEQDFEPVQDFLTHTYKCTHSYQNWIPSRFENIKFGPCGTEYQIEEDQYITIWEDTNDSDTAFISKIVAVTFLKPSGDCWIQIHPDYKLLEKEIVPWVEKQRRKMKKKETQEVELRFYVDETDEKRIILLTELGYENCGLEEYNRKRPLDTLIPKYQLPQGFTIRSVDVEKDFVHYKQILTAVFPHCSHMTKRRAKIFSTALFYKKDLDLVVMDPHGNFTAICTVRIDPKSRIAELEPVGTHPDYRKHGLAKAIICEGLRRVQKYKPTAICISGAAVSEAANKLYESVGFTEKTEVHLWWKKL